MKRVSASMFAFTFQSLCTALNKTTDDLESSLKSIGRTMSIKLIETDTFEKSNQLYIIIYKLIDEFMDNLYKSKKEVQIMDENISNETQDQHTVQVNPITQNNTIGKLKNVDSKHNLCGSANNEDTVRSEKNKFSENHITKENNSTHGNYLSKGNNKFGGEHISKEDKSANENGPSKDNNAFSEKYPSDGIQKEMDDSKVKSSEKQNSLDFSNENSHSINCCTNISQGGLNNRLTNEELNINGQNGAEDFGPGSNQNSQKTKVTKIEVTSESVNNMSDFNKAKHFCENTDIIGNDLQNKNMEQGPTIEGKNHLESEKPGNISKDGLIVNTENYFGSRKSGNISKGESSITTKNDHTVYKIKHIQKDQIRDNNLEKSQDHINNLTPLKYINYYFANQEFEPQQTKKQITKLLIQEENPLVSRYVYSRNEFCADALIAGVIEGYMFAHGLESCVTAYSVENNETFSTTYLIEVYDANW